MVFIEEIDNVVGPHYACAISQSSTNAKQEKSRVCKMVEGSPQFQESAVEGCKNTLKSTTGQCDYRASEVKTRPTKMRDQI